MVYVHPVLTPERNHRGGVRISQIGQLTTFALSARTPGVFSSCSLVLVWVPLMVTAVVRTLYASNVSLVWDANSEPDIAGYNIYYGPASGVYTNIIEAGNVTNIIISGVDPGGIYYFVATAFTTNGLESDPSNEVTYGSGTNQVDQPPTLDPVPDVTIEEDAGLQTVPLTGITPGFGEVQPLVLTAISDNPTLIPNPTISYTNSESIASLSLVALPDATGTAVVSVVVSDASTNVVRAFNVIVNPVNDPPTVSSIPDQTIQRNQSTLPITLTVGDVESPSEGLALTGKASNTNLVPESQIVFSGIGLLRTLTITPTQGKIGTTFIHIRVSDGLLETSTTFLLTVSGNGVGIVPSALAGTPILSVSSVDSFAGTTIEWTSTPGATYRLLSKEDLEDAAWQNLSGNIVADSQTTSWIDGTAPGNPTRFYLILLP